MNIRLIGNRIVFSPGEGEWGVGGSTEPVFEVTGDEIATVLRAGQTIAPSQMTGTLFGEKYDLEVKTVSNVVFFRLVAANGEEHRLPTQDILMKVVVAIAYNNDQKGG